MVCSSSTSLVRFQFVTTGILHYSELSYKYLQGICNVHIRKWSTDGMTTRFLSTSQVVCTSNHLTSFAVLTDHTGVTITNNPGVKYNNCLRFHNIFHLQGNTRNSESFALEVTSYIGVSISIVCLIITIVLLIALRYNMSCNNQTAYAYVYFIESSSRKVHCYMYTLTSHLLYCQHC